MVASAGALHQVRPGSAHYRGVPALAERACGPEKAGSAGRPHEPLPPDGSGSFPDIINGSYHVTDAEGGVTCVRAEITQAE